MTRRDPLPFVPPVASTAPLQTPRSAGPSALLAAGKTPRETRTRRQSERIGRHGLTRLREQLSDRDLAILQAVASHRFLTTQHLQRLHFIDHATSTSAARTCRLVTQRLGQLNVLHSLDRRIGGIRAGSASYVWTTGAVGRRLLDAERDGNRSRRHQEPSERFLDHALAIADVHLTLKEAHRGGQLELLSLDLEPACWRPYTSSAGSRAVLQPDLAATTGAGDYEDAWFIEVDLGSEHLPTLLRKCQQYQAYRETGIEQQRYGGFPIVIWLLQTERRVEQLVEAIQRSRQLDGRLFVVTTPAGLLPTITNNNQLRGGDHA